MNYYNAEFKLNKKKSENSSKRTRLNTSIVTLTLISLILISAPVALFSTTVFADEPGHETILNDLGFTNISPSDIETFPSGIYQATLLAEFAGYHYTNVLSYYPVETNDYQTIFTGPEGATGNLGGYVDPPVSKIFEVDTQFGLCLLYIPAPHRYFTEHWRNPDYPKQHTTIYVNLASPNMYLICWEDLFRVGDSDYNDMVFSLEQIFPPEIVSVIRSPETPNNNQSVTITAQVTKGSNELESVILSYQIGSSSWTNVTMNLESSGYVAEIPAQPYSTQVNYKVYATDTNGYSDISTLDSYTIMIPGSSPIAVLIYSPPVADTGEDINFDASSSYDPDGTIVSYSWDFGDGTTSSDATVSHSYEEDGEYTVTLRVVDNDGLVGSKVATQVVKNRPPTAALTASASSINEKETASFDATSSYDLDGTIVSYTWSFGDGTATTGTTGTHSYANTGFYTVTLTVFDNDGATDECKYTLFVKDLVNGSPVSPVATFTKSAETVNIDETVSFDASESYDSDGSIVSYTWDYGDGNTATGVTADHAYSEEGTYTVTLTVTDNDGLTDATTTTITATTTSTQNQSPVASFTESKQTVSRGESIHFDGSESHDPDGSIVSYTWDYGDGNTATGVTADHAYSEEGTYTVTLTVTDDDGDSSSVVAEITVETETTVSLAVLSGIGLGITALTVALLVFFFIRRKKKKKTEDN